MLNVITHLKSGEYIFHVSELGVSFKDKPWFKMVLSTDQEKDAVSVLTPIDNGFQLYSILELLRDLADAVVVPIPPKFLNLEFKTFQNLYFDVGELADLLKHLPAIHCYLDLTRGNSKAEIRVK